MSQWGQNDQSVTANSTTIIETSKGAPIGTQARVGGGLVSMIANATFGNTSPGSKASIDATMYGNTTVGAFVPNVGVGVFAVNATSLSTVGGGIVLGRITNPGSGYAANAAVTLTVINGGSGGTANTTMAGGRATALTANQAGSGYITPPSVAIAAPAAININANTTSFTTTALLLGTANSLFLAGDKLTYNVPTGNTAVPGLTGNTTYYVTFSNTTALTLSTTLGGANLSFTPSAVSTEVHTIKGDTATGYFDTGAAYPQVTHSGWILRREGTGGRAGRVHYETLVAMHSVGVNGTTATGVYGTASIISSNATNAAVV